MAGPLIPRTVYRNFELDGVPASGRHEPRKADIIQLLDRQAAMAGANGVHVRTLAQLAAVTPASGTFPAGSVSADPTKANNGWYVWAGAAWVKTRPFADTLSLLEITGGTANAVQAASLPGVDPAQVFEFLVTPATSNTGPVTLSVNGAAAKPVHDIDGNELAAGVWAQARVMRVFDNGDEWRSTFQADVQALLQQAIEALDEASQLTTPGNGTVTDAKVAGNAAIQSSKIAHNGDPLDAVLAPLAGGFAQAPRKAAQQATENSAGVGVIRLPDGRLLLARTNYQPNAPVSILEMTVTGGVVTATPFQTVDGDGVNSFGRVHDVKFHTTHDGEVVMVVADYRNEANTQYESNSMVFLFDAGQANGLSSTGLGLFEWRQNIATRGCRRVVLRRHAGETIDWLTLASEVSSTVNEGGSVHANSYRQKVAVYQWNQADNDFDLYQEKVNLKGVNEAAVIKSGSWLGLLPAQYYDDNANGSSSPGNLLNGEVFQYVSSMTKFGAWKTLEMAGARCVHDFYFGGRTFFALGYEIGGEYSDLESPIYEVKSNGDLLFVTSVPTRGCERITSIVRNGICILGYCNAWSGQNAESTFDSSAFDLYRFDLMQAHPLGISVPAFGLFDAQLFEEGGDLFAALAESYATSTNSVYQNSRIVNLGRLEVVPSIGAAPRRLLPGVMPGQCFLERVSATTIRLVPCNGNRLWIHGKMYPVKRAGHSRDNSGLAAMTSYNVFAWGNTSGSFDIEISTRARFQLPVNGLFVDDQTLQKTFVGSVTTDNNAQFPNAGSVVSWFNRGLL